ncbi:hypothetical protein SAMN05660816_00037 [Niastella yeongjuensis]|nr:hypothetical protein SAMN05660816_00037 [Niastella yeongjuensis]
MTLFKKLKSSAGFCSIDNYLSFKDEYAKQKPVQLIMRCKMEWFP